MLHALGITHVVSVGALNPDDTSAEFSTANRNVDLAAPGVQVPAATPLGLDTSDGLQDGYELVDGTSFAAPTKAFHSSRGKNPLMNSGLNSVSRSSIVTSLN